MHTPLQDIWFLCLVLAAFRLTELFAVDQIMEKPRPFLQEMFPNLMKCIRCINVWASGAALVLFLIGPWLTVPFGLSWLNFAFKDFEVFKRGGRRFVVELDANNNMNVRRQDLTPEELGRIHLIVAGLQRGAAQK